MSVVYVVAEDDGDDACGGKNLYGIYTTEAAAEARVAQARSTRPVYIGGPCIYAVPLDTPGYLWYCDDEFRVEE